MPGGAPHCEAWDSTAINFIKLHPPFPPPWSCMWSGNFRNVGELSYRFNQIKSSCHVEISVNTLPELRL